LKKIAIFWTLFFIFASFHFVQGQESIKFSGVDTLIDRAVAIFYQKKFDRAIYICDSIITEYPDNPLGYLGLAGVYHLLMLNYRVSYYDMKFDSVSSLAIKVGEKTIKKYHNDAYAYFVLGASYGFRGLNRIRKKKWLGAFHDGLKGISNIKKAQRLNKNLYDVYYALGLFYYWKSVKARFLTSLRLMKDEREKGIEYLKIAIKKGHLAKLEGKFALIEIYYYEDRYEEALEECQTLEDTFKDDPTWNYLMAKINGKLSHWEDSRTYFTRVLELLDEFPLKSNSYYAECYYGLAKAAFEMENYDTAAKEIKLAEEFSQKSDKKKEIEGPLLDSDLVLKRMKKLKTQLQKMGYELESSP